MNPRNSPEMHAGSARTGQARDTIACALVDARWILYRDSIGVLTRVHQVIAALPVTRYVGPALRRAAIALVVRVGRATSSELDDSDRQHLLAAFDEARQCSIILDALRRKYGHDGEIAAAIREARRLLAPVLVQLEQLPGAATRCGGDRRQDHSNQ